MATRSVYESFDRVGAAHARGSMTTTEVYDWGAPPHRPRVEMFDFGRKIWIKPEREIQRQLNRLSDAQLERLLRNMPFGFRRAPEFEDEVSLDAKLEAALAAGVLQLGGRSYKVSPSPTGNIRVTGAFGTHAFTRGALLDVIQRGHF